MNNYPVGLDIKLIGLSLHLLLSFVYTLIYVPKFHVLAQMAHCKNKIKIHSEHYCYFRDRNGLFSELSVGVVGVEWFHN